MPDCLACEQALHLGDIVKSTRARGTREETQLRRTRLQGPLAPPSRLRRSLAQIGELARRLQIVTKVPHSKQNVPITLQKFPVVVTKVPNSDVTKVPLVTKVPSLKVTGNHVMYNRGAWFLRVIMSSSRAFRCLPSVKKQKHDFHVCFVDRARYPKNSWRQGLANTKGRRRWHRSCLLITWKIKNWENLRKRKS